jgi:hypothetical protein
MGIPGGGSVEVILLNMAALDSSFSTAAAGFTGNV